MERNDVAQLSDTELPAAFARVAAADVPADRPNPLGTPTAGGSRRSQSMRAAVGDAYTLVRTRLEPERMIGRIARSSIKSIVVNVTGAAVSFAVQIGLSRVLGQDQYGIYLMAMGWLAVGLLFSVLELEVTSVRFISAYLATRRWDLLLGFTRDARSVVLIASLTISVLGAAVVFFFTDVIAQKGAALPGALLTTCALLPAAAMMVLESAMLQGFHRYVAAQFPMNLARPLAFGAMLILGMTAAVFRLTPAIAVALNLASALVAVALSRRWHRRVVPPELRMARPAHDRPLWVRTTFPLLGGSLAQFIISQQADIVVVGVMLTSTDVAMYGAASQLTIPLVLILGSVTYVAQSIIADIHARNPEQLQSLIRSVTWITTALGIPLAFALILLGRPLLELYGEGFARGHAVLIILTVSQLVVGMAGSLAGYLLTMTSHEREAVSIIGLAASLDLVLAVMLTPRLGAVGTALATLTAAVVRATALAAYIRRVMGLRLLAYR